MEVILKDDVEHLGHRGDVVKVADGYARNYLLPRKLAMQANEANKAVIEQMKAAASRRAAADKAAAEAQAAQLAPITLEFTRKSGENGHLFGSVTTAEIAAELATKGFEIYRRKIQLEEPIKTIGDFTVSIRIYRDVIAQIRVKVAGDGSEVVAEPVAAEAAAE